MTLHSILSQLKNGALSAEAAEVAISELSSQPLGFAHVDLSRAARCGFPEVVFAEGKTVQWLLGVVQTIVDANQDCLVTRLSVEQQQELRARFPSADVNPLSRTFWRPADERTATLGVVRVLTAGTGDLPVAMEAVVTARALGAAVEMIADVGVAGLHRLLNKYDEWKAADVLVVVAGMDGALPSVVGGLARVPVIAVPTSIGYGTSFGGVAALLTMLNSCAPNVVVTNIDNGFRAGYVSAMIARQIHLPK